MNPLYCCCTSAINRKPIYELGDKGSVNTIFLFTAIKINHQIFMSNSPHLKIFINRERGLTYLVGNSRHDELLALHASSLVSMLLIEVNF